MQGGGPYDQFAVWRNSTLASLAGLFPSMACSFVSNGNFTTVSGTYLSQYLGCSYGANATMFANIAAPAASLGMVFG